MTVTLQVHCGTLRAASPPAFRKTEESREARRRAARRRAARHLTAFKTTETFVSTTVNSVCIFGRDALRPPLDWLVKQTTRITTGATQADERRFSSGEVKRRLKSDDSSTQTQMERRDGKHDLWAWKCQNCHLSLQVRTEGDEKPALPGASLLLRSFWRVFVLLLQQK